MVSYSEILSSSFAGNSGSDYLMAFGAFIIAGLGLKVFKYFIINRSLALAEKTKNDYDDLIMNIFGDVGWPFYFFFSLYLSIQFIQVPSLVERGLYLLFLVSVMYYVVMGVQDVIRFVTQKIIAKKREENEEEDISIIQLLSDVSKGIVWVTAILLLLSNMGYNISALLAGMGIGGIAVAIALQNVLSDIFSSISIYFDKPFKVGDFIIVGENMGVVKKIGIKTTRLVSLWGQEIVISNSELTSTRINNYKKMEQRRIHFTFGVTYQTPSDKLKQVLDIVKEAFEGIEMASLDRVHFKEFGNSSLNFEVAYYVATGDYNKYMDCQQAINFALKERFEEEGIEFAYPTQTLYLNREGAEGA